MNWQQSNFRCPRAGAGSASRFRSRRIISIISIISIITITTFATIITIITIIIIIITIIIIIIIIILIGPSERLGPAQVLPVDIYC